MPAFSALSISSDGTPTIKSSNPSPLKSPVARLSPKLELNPLSHCELNLVIIRLLERSGKLSIAWTIPSPPEFEVDSPLAETIKSPNPSPLKSPDASADPK